PVAGCKAAGDRCERLDEHRCRSGLPRSGLSIAPAHNPAWPPALSPRRGHCRADSRAMTLSETCEIKPGYVISRIIRGGWQLAGGHGTVERDGVTRDLAAFYDAGVTTFDCADIYTGAGNDWRLPRGHVAESRPARTEPTQGPHQVCPGHRPVAHDHRSGRAPHHQSLPAAPAHGTP